MEKELKNVFDFLSELKQPVTNYFNYTEKGEITSLDMNIDSSFIASLMDETESVYQEYLIKKLNKFSCSELFRNIGVENKIFSILIKGISQLYQTIPLGMNFKIHYIKVEYTYRILVQCFYDTNVSETDSLEDFQQAVLEDSSNRISKEIKDMRKQIRVLLGLQSTYNESKESNEDYLKKADAMSVDGFLVDIELNADNSDGFLLQSSEY